ncbi:ribonuclease 3-like [Acanthaster planci]|uniref:Ribonuclease 3-like n=1 Tax=Acanthaster planci TaxID=133434 RepID=A0A8B7XWG8_ACAPL|nr:ribonuclease 3-like [Acanthaster planci]
MSGHNPQEFTFGRRQPPTCPPPMRGGPRPSHPSRQRLPGPDQGEMWYGPATDQFNQETRPLNNLPGDAQGQHNLCPPSHPQFPPPCFPPLGYCGFSPFPPTFPPLIPPPGPIPLDAPPPYTPYPEPAELPQHPGPGHVCDQAYDKPQESSKPTGLPQSDNSLNLNETVRRDHRKDDRDKQRYDQPGRFRDLDQSRSRTRDDRSSIKAKRSNVGPSHAQSSATSRSPRQMSRRLSPSRDRSPRRRSGSPRQLRSPVRKKSPSLRRSPARGSSSRHNRSPRRSRSPYDRRSPHRLSEKWRSRRTRSRSPAPGELKADCSRHDHSLRRQRTSQSPSKRSEQDDTSRYTDRRRHRRRSPLNQTKRWDELEAKTAALEESYKPLTLTAGADQGDKMDDAATEDDPPWIQCSPRGNFYSADPKMQKNQSSVSATDKLKDLLGRFQEEIVNRGPKGRAVQPKLEVPQPDVHWHVHKDSDADMSDESSSSSSEEEDESGGDPLAFLKMKEKHPARLADNL